MNEREAAPDSERNEPVAEDSGHGAEESEGAKSVVASESRENAEDREGKTIDSATTDLSPEVKNKLLKLEKLEAKYTQLLLAYRKAHARNSLIEPFEAKLREVTPLTSISEPTAFVEYLNQVEQKGDMVMQEFRKASGERDELRTKLGETERRAKAAEEENERLVQDSQRPPDKGRTEKPLPADPKRESDEDTPEDEASKDMFSYDEEVPRLQSEVEPRDERISRLEHDNTSLKSDLTSAKESAEHMMRDLESKQAQLEAQKSQAEGHQDARERLSGTIKTLEDDVVTARARLESAEGEVSDLKEKLQSSDAKAMSLEEVVKSSTSEASSFRSRNEELQRHAKQSNDEVERQKGQILSQEQELARLKAAPSTNDNTTAPLTNGAPQSSTVSTAAASDPVSQGGKKNKKKKKKGPVGGMVTSEAQSTQTTNNVAQAGPTTATMDPQKRLEETLRDLQDKNTALSQLKEKLQLHEDLKEEVDHLRDELASVGQEHVETKDRVKMLEADRKVLEDELAAYKVDRKQADSQAAPSRDLDELKRNHALLETERDKLLDKVKDFEGQISTHGDDKASTAKQEESRRAELSKELEQLRGRAESLQSEQTAAQQLASSRFKEISNLQSNLQKLRPELSSLRSENADLRSTRDELAVKTSEVRNLQSTESRIHNELDAIKQQMAAKDTEIKRLSEKFSSESIRRSSLEESNRKLERDLQRARNEHQDVKAARDSHIKKFHDVEAETSSLRTRAQELESDLEKLSTDASSLREEMSMKTAQYASAQSLMNSQRDQSSEIATQLKEAKERAESLEEELTDAHRLMNERAREGETLRRILSDIEGRADSRVKEMRERMEVAIQERDRAEDEASTIGRRRGREVDDVKNKLREVERELRKAQEEKSDVERTERDLRQRTAEDSEKVERVNVEVAEVRKAMSELRDALDESERQAREVESEKSSVQRSLEQAHSQLEKVQKSSKTMSEELKSLRATRIRPTDSPVQSSRSSTDSNLPGRVASPNTQSREEARRGSGTAGSNVDYVYLKNVLLQFLEQKDKKYQAQLIPVLGMLLHFDK